jgi:hypothetical protein
MNQKRTGRPSSSEQIIKDIKRETRKQYSVKEKIRIVLDGLHAECSLTSENLLRSFSFDYSGKTLQFFNMPCKCRTT